MKSGVYAIVCLATNHAYVGGSKGLQERKVKHESELRGGVHYCKEMQADWDAYGDAAFRFDVMAITEDIAEAEMRVREEVAKTCTLYQQSGGLGGLRGAGKGAAPAVEGPVGLNGKPSKMIRLRGPGGEVVLFKSYYAARKCIGCQKGEVAGLAKGTRLSVKGWTLAGREDLVGAKKACM